MKPLRLSLHAFGPYPSAQEVDFGRLGAHGLFLIHGPTGSGKSTLLDAIAYALFDSKKVERAGADFASTLNVNDETRVVFDFTVRGQGYRVTRQPAQRRAKRRGDGFTDVAAEGWLERLDAKGRPVEVLADKTSEVTRQVEDLLGCNAEQFRQTVVLPQGAFREVVTDDKTRREVLSRVFATHRFAVLTHELKDAAAALSRRAEDLQGQRSRIFEKAGLETRDELDAAVAAAAGARDGAKEARAEKDTVRAASERALQEGRALQERFGVRDDLRRKRAQLDERAEAIAADRARLDAGRRAARVLDRRSARDRAAAAHAAALRARDDASEAATLAGEALTSAQRAWRAEDGRVAERTGAETELRRLEALEEDVGAVAELQQDRDTRRREAAEAAALVEEMDPKLQAAAEERAALDEERIGIAAKAAAADDLHDEVLILATHAESLAAIAAEERAIADDGRARDALERAPQDASHDGTASLLDVIREHAAGLAVLDLEPGVPCPVCGSKHHPAAHAPGDVAALQRILERYDEVQEQVTSLRTRIGEAQRRRDSLLDRHGWRHERPDPDAVRTALDDVRARLKEAREARARLETIDTRLRTLNSTLERDRATRSELVRRRATLSAEATGLDARIAAVHAKLPEPLREPQAFRRALGGARDYSLALARALEAARSALDGATQGAQTSRARLEEREAALTTAAAERDRTASDLSERLREQGFEDEASLRAAELAPPTLQELTERVEAFDEALADTRTQLRALDEELTGRELPDLASLTTARDASRVAWEAADAAFRQAETTHARLAGLLKELATAEGDYEALLERLQATQNLARLAGGQLKGRAKVDFETFVLQSIFGSVLAIGNDHLRAMTGGRYALHLVEDAEAASTRGLELEVADHHAGGARRSAKTLSGGEGFLAALALALGLSESARRSSGGIELGALFIDEGFGSLDDAALDKVIRILRALPAAEDRMVGVITHVAEMKRRIPTQLLVIPQERGSRIEVRVNE